VSSWSALGATLGVSALVLLAAFTLCWRIAMRRNQVSIVDILWPLAFAFVAVAGLAFGDGYFNLSAVLAWMTFAWSIRLALYLGRRNLGHGEDPRYAAIREKIGPRFDRWALTHIFLVQAGIAWIVSLPIQVGMNLSGHFRSWSTGGLCLFAVGFVFESVGDAQLAAFKRDPANAGRVMDRGLWRFTRHPNYFGDTCVWWGIWLTAAVNGWGAATIIGPALMTFLLVRVTGKRLLEHRLTRSRPGYAEYVARTSGFFPLPPKRGAMARKDAIT